VLFRRCRLVSAGSREARAPRLPSREVSSIPATSTPLSYRLVSAHGLVVAVERVQDGRPDDEVRDDHPVVDRGDGEGPPAKDDADAPPSANIFCHPSARRPGPLALPPAAPVQRKTLPFGLVQVRLNSGRPEIARDFVPCFGFAASGPPEFTAS
jgi:hypothetical protein